MIFNQKNCIAKCFISFKSKAMCVCASSFSFRCWLIGYYGRLNSHHYLPTPNLGLIAVMLPVGSQICVSVIFCYLVYLPAFCQFLTI